MRYSTRLPTCLLGGALRSLFKRLVTNRRVWTGPLVLNHHRALVFESDLNFRYVSLEGGPAIFSKTNILARITNFSILYSHRRTVLSSCCPITTTTRAIMTAMRTSSSRSKSPFVTVRSVCQVRETRPRHTVVRSHDRPFSSQNPCPSLFSMASVQWGPSFVSSSSKRCRGVYLPDAFGERRLPAAICQGTRTRSKLN